MQAPWFCLRIGYSRLFLILTLSHLFKSLRVCRSNEVCCHVVDSPLGIHQVLIVLTFDLNHSHHNTVNHVDWFALFISFCIFYLILFFAFALLVLDVVMHFILGFTFVNELLIVVSNPLLVELVEVLLRVDSEWNLEILNDLNHFCLAHPVVLSEVLLFGHIK